MKALVVGAAGFVGEYLMEALIDADYKVCATTLKGVPINILHGVEVQYLDITSPCNVDDVLKEVRPDVVFHLAAQSSVSLSWEKPLLTTEVNAVGAVNLLEGIKRNCPTAKAIIVGSSEEYGKIDYSKPVKETANSEPANVYALTKLFQEKLGKLYAEAYGLNLIMTRSFNHFGPRQSNRFVVADFCNQVVSIEAGRQQPLIKVGNLESCRNFTDVRDIVKAYILLAEKGSKGQIYNVGSGNCYSIRQILDMVLSFSAIKIDVRVDERKFRPVDVPCIRADITKLKKLGWRPQIPLKKTIEDTLNYFRNNVK